MARADTFIRTSDQIPKRIADGDSYKAFTDWTCRFWHTKRVFFQKDFKHNNDKFWKAACGTGRICSLWWLKVGTTAVTSVCVLREEQEQSPYLHPEFSCSNKLGKWPQMLWFFKWKEQCHRVEGAVFPKKEKYSVFQVNCLEDGGWICWLTLATFLSPMGPQCCFPPKETYGWIHLGPSFYIVQSKVLWLGCKGDWLLSKYVEDSNVHHLGWHGYLLGFRKKVPHKDVSCKRMVTQTLGLELRWVFKSYAWRPGQLFLLSDLQELWGSFPRST